MNGSTTDWAVLFTDGTLKRRGFNKFSSITLVGTLTLVMHLFSFTDCHKWKQIRILHFTFFVHCAKSGFVTLYHPICRVRRFAVEQSSFRNGSAIRTEVDRSIAINLKFTLPLWRALYITAFPTLILQTTAWKWVLIFCGNHKTEQRNRSIKNVSPIFHISPCPLP